MKRREIHEQYHSVGRIQKRIISDRNFTYRNLIRILKKYTKGRKRILDIGCGVGTIDFYLASKGKTVLGIDISQNAINHAERNAHLLKLSSYVKYRQVDFSKEDIHSRFDLVLMSEVLEHLPHDSKILRKTYKVLDSDKGVLIISVPSRNAPLFKLGLLQDFDRRVGHLRRYSESDLRRKLSHTEYKIIEIYKTEGILRNLLFTSRLGEILIKLIRGPLSDIVAVVDQFLIPVFGESQIYVVAKKK